jgi:cadmium resistance protein CadD (predicted permease)
VLENLLVAVLAFASTNLDDFLLLIGFFALPAFRAPEVILGQYLGIGALTAVSLVGARLAVALPEGKVGLLGLVPVAIGAKKLWAARRGADDDPKPPPAAGAHNVLTVAAATLADGADNIGVYIPIFATRAAHGSAVIVGTFALMTALWCAAAHRLAKHPALGAPFRRYGPKLLPWVLIAVGIAVLTKTS